MSQKPAVHVNSSRGALRRPLSLARQALRDLPTAISVSVTLAIRELMANYRKSKLGFLWLALQPALYAGIFVIIKFGMTGAGFEVDVGAAPPALFALVGMTLYQAWLEALTEQLDALRRSASVLKTQRFPPEIFFFTPLVTVLINLGVRMAVIGLAVVALGWAPSLTLQALWFPLAALGVVFSGQALGFLLLPLSSLYQDVRQFVSSIGLALLLLSPILYPATTRADSLLYTINQLNPLGATLATARDLLLNGNLVLLQPALIWIGALVAITAFMVVFLRAILPILVERLEG